MIIVSQDKSFILNFNNIEAIEIGNPKENEFEGTIYARLMSNYFYKIGEYKRKERAKEVLALIYKIYSDQTLIKHINSEYQNKLIAGDKNQYFDVYEMPED